MLLFGIRSLEVHTPFKRGIINIFQITTYAIIAGCFLDILKFAAENKYLAYLNVGQVIILIVVLILFYLRRISYAAGFNILIYTTLVNIISGKFLNAVFIDNPLRVNFFLRDSVFIIFLLTLASFTLHRIHAIIIGIMYITVITIFSLTVNNSFLNDSLVLLSVLFISYCGLTWYLVGIFEKAITDQQKQSELILQQSAELLKRNQDLAKLNRSKDMLMSIIGHDLKNPFNIILLSAQLLGSKFETLSDEKKKNIIDTIESTSLKTYSLLENLLKWARMQTESVKFTPEGFSLNQIILNTLDLNMESIKKKNITLDFDNDLNYQVYADKDMMSTVVRNLISNAVKFTHQQGHISIRCTNEGDIIRFTITDDGIGLKKQELENLFNIDKIILGTGTGGELGTGLGLILCRDFLDMNRGVIEVKSEEGAGSSFSFTLPKPD